MRPARLHNLRGNRAERSPHRLFVFDTETHPLHESKRSIERLRLWCAETVQRHGRRPGRPAIVQHQGQSAPQLLDALEGACRSTETTWAFAHNLGFDLAVTRLPLLLRERGWVMTAHAMATATPWARLARGSHRLVLADSTSWLPGPLAGIGVQVGVDKPELPQELAPADEWWWRCRQDVTILRLALCELMDWWDRHRLGAWSITGPQTGFNALRHQWNPHTVVIDPDPTARAFEREAITAGRRECWRVGKLPWGDYREIDFERAHATIAANCPLPKRRSVHFDQMDLGDWRLRSDRWGPIARCLIQTNTPRYPLSWGGRLFYPLGRFWTTLAGPEIREALTRGELLQVGPGYVYQLGAHMAGWGRWVLQLLAPDSHEAPPVSRHAVKAWSRTVPGKWAARTGRTFHEGPALEQGWDLEHGLHHPSGARCSVLDMAAHREVILHDQEADDGFPAVLAWIQSEVRVRLGRLIDAIGPAAMVSCNTDGLIYEHGANWWPPNPAVDLEPLRVAEKGRYAQLEVLSPQHVVHDGTRRLAGIPAGAEQVSPYAYRWKTWPRLPSQIAQGDPRGYVREWRTVDLSGVPVNRWVGSDGTCWPVTAEVGEDGETRLNRPVEVVFDVHAAPLLARQHPVLADLLSVGLE